MPSYNIQDGNEGFKRFKTVGEGTNDNPYVPVVGINVVPDVDSNTGWTSPLSDTNVVSEKLIKETIDGQEITAASFNTSDGVLTLNKTDGNVTVDLDGRYLTATGSNTYVTSASFNTSNGVLTLTLNDASTVTVDLDGRFLQNIIEDTTPQLGGNLNLNSNDITGTGDIDITGEITATTLIGNMRGATIFKAKAGEALTKGDPVYISGDDLSGNQPVVSIADSDNASKMPCFGLAAETVSINASVNVVTFGTLSGLDTSSYNQGDILYISTSGTLSATKPSGESSLIQNIGKVMRSHASAGSIKVGGAGRTNDVPNLNDGNVFIGNASNQAETRALAKGDVGLSNVSNIDTTNASNISSGTLSSSRLPASATFGDGISTDGSDVYTDNGAFITRDLDGDFADRTGSNIDHIWHDDSSNAWNFCSDTTYRAAGNSELKAQGLHIKSEGDCRILIEADTDNESETDNAYIKMTQDGGAVGSIIGLCPASNKDPENETYTGALSNSLLINNFYSGASITFGTNNSGTGGVRLRIRGDGDVDIYNDLSVTGAISKGSGSFDIPHPDPTKKDTHRLRHYFVETPSAGGNIYKYQLECKQGDNYIDLPDYFEHLNENTLVWVNPFKHFGGAWGEVIGGKKAKIVVEQSGIYNILIFGDRKDAIAMQEFEKYGIEYENKE